MMALQLRLAGIETRLAVLMVMVGDLYVIGAPAIWMLAAISAALEAR